MGSTAKYEAANMPSEGQDEIQGAVSVRPDDQSNMR